MNPHVFAAILDHRARALRITDVDLGEVILVIPHEEYRTEGGLFLLGIVEPNLSRGFGVKAAKSALKITLILCYLLRRRIDCINELSSVHGNVVCLKGGEKPNVKSLVVVALYVGIVGRRPCGDSFH